VDKFDLVFGLFKTFNLTLTFPVVRVSHHSCRFYWYILYSIKLKMINLFSLIHSFNHLFIHLIISRFLALFIDVYIHSFTYSRTPRCSTHFGWSVVRIYFGMGSIQADLHVNVSNRSYLGFDCNILI